MNDILDLDTRDDGRRIVTASLVDDVESVADSPVEKAKSFLGEDLRRDFIAAGDDHPLVITAGSKEALSSSANVELIRELSDGIYSGTTAFWREWAQNHIASVTREAKRRVKDELGVDALFHEVEHDHPDNDETHTLLLWKSAEDILDLAREECGYLPTIEFHVDHDEGRLVTRDNGIGMTTGEVIDVWNEPAESGSGIDLSSAGTKGLGALTWITVGGEEGIMVVKTRTRRQETFLKSEPIPDRDREGFKFLSYLGGVLPVDGDVEDGFYGIEFDIALKSSLNTKQFKSALQEYTEVLPVSITWYETENGQTTDDEFDRVDFFDRYDDDILTVDRPGEFRIALGPPGKVEKGRSHTDTFLMDNPIDRNSNYGQKVNTLFNEHIQILNEQGLIVAGPHRGMRRVEVDELAGDKSDIWADDKPMPDVPLPEPTTSRDQLQNDEALDRFLDYVSYIAGDEELSKADDYLNDLLEKDTREGVIEHVRERGSEYSLIVKLIQKHSAYRALKHAPRLMEFLDGRDSIDFIMDRALTEAQYDEMAVIEGGEQNMPPKITRGKHVVTTHPKYDLLDEFTMLYDEVSYATKEMGGNPNTKEDREEGHLGDLIGTMGKWPIYVGATINEDRAEVFFHEENEPDGAIVKPGRGYNRWQTGVYESLYGGLIKNVPMRQSDAEDADGDWHVPDHIDERNTKTVETLHESGGDGTDRAATFKIRHTENSAVDTRSTFGDVADTLDETPFGEPLKWLDSTPLKEAKPWLVLFPDNLEKNISDYYHLSAVTNIARCTAGEADELLRSSNTFLADDFETMLADTRIAYTSPFNGQSYENPISKLVPDRTLVIYDRELRKTEADAILGEYTDGSQMPDPDDDSDGYDLAREAVVEALCEDRALKNPLDNPDERDDDAMKWVAVDAAQFDDADAWRIEAYLLTNLDTDLFRSYGSERRVDGSVVTTLFRNSRNSLVKEGHSLTHFMDWKVRSKVIERSMYPAWHEQSHSWTRVNKSYNGPTNVEKQLLYAMRDLGIDPYEEYYRDNPSSLRRVLNERFGGC